MRGSLCFVVASLRVGGCSTVTDFDRFHGSDTDGGPGDAGPCVDRGWNTSGQIGIGTTSTNEPSPRRILVGLTPNDVAAGGNYTCAIATNAGGTTQLRCWGDNSAGQYGNGTVLGSASPTVISISWTPAAVKAGERHTCATSTVGGLFCWGDNANGQVGDGTTTNRLTPYRVIAAASAFDNGMFHTCAVDSSSQLFCWGAGGAGKIGDGAFADRLVPTMMSPVPPP